MYTFKQKLDLIEANFGHFKVSGSEKNASVLCPSCIASGKITNKKKLSVCLETGVFHCWVCEYKGRNIGSAAIKYSSFNEKARELATVFGGIKKGQKEDIVKEVAVLPDGFKLIATLSTRERKRYKKHINYLARRGYSEEDIWKFRIGVSNSYDFKSSVIFPSNSKDGNLNYFIARSIDPDSFRRYRNCTLSRKDIIFRELDVEFKNELILTEGVFDLVNCPKNSTCILGSWLDENYALFDKIVENKTPVILCLDPDAKAKSIKIAKLLSSYCISVKISQHKEKDFGDMTKKQVEYFINTAKPFEFADSVGYLIESISSGSIF